MIDITKIINNSLNSNNIVIRNGTVTINGKKVDLSEHGVTDKDRQITLVINGDINGDIDTQGNISCSGNITGDINLQGNLNCADVNGDVSCQGSIRMGGKR